MTAYTTRQVRAQNNFGCQRKSGRPNSASLPVTQLHKLAYTHWAILCILHAAFCFPAQSQTACKGYSFILISQKPHIDMPYAAH